MTYHIVDVKAMTAFPPETNGDCFRYITDVNGEQSQLSRGSFCTFETIQRFVSFHNSLLEFESEELKNKAQDLVRRIKELDAISFAFRFPFTSNGDAINFVPQKKILQEMVKLHQDADTFLTFGVGVLAKYGYLRLGNDILYQLYN